jgi:putative redox protein
MMTTSKLTHDYRVEIGVRDHYFISDVDKNLGGNDEGPNPHELVEAALCACTGMTVKMYAKRKQIPLQEINVNVKIEKEGVVNLIKREIELIGDLSDEQRVQLLQIADKCPIHKLLIAQVSIETSEV